VSLVAASADPKPFRRLGGRVGSQGAVRFADGKCCQQPASVSWRDPAGDGFVEQTGHRWTFINKDADEALRFGEGEGTLQCTHGLVRIAPGLKGQLLDTAHDLLPLEVRVGIVLASAVVQPASGPAWSIGACEASSSSHTS